METSAITDQKKVQSTTAEKITLPVFWDSQGPIPQHYHDRGPTVDTAHYAMYREKVRPAISRH
jgi:hypothetical protein